MNLICLRLLIQLCGDLFEKWWWVWCGWHGFLPDAIEWVCQQKSGRLPSCLLASFSPTCHDPCPQLHSNKEVLTSKRLRDQGSGSHKCMGLLHLLEEATKWHHLLSSPWRIPLACMHTYVCACVRVHVCACVRVHVCVCVCVCRRFFLIVHV